MEIDVLNLILSLLKAITLLSNSKFKTVHLIPLLEIKIFNYFAKYFFQL